MSSPAAGATATPFLARRVQPAEVPEALASGSFGTEGGCVTFSPSSSATAYLALMPASALLWVEAGAAVGIKIGDRRVRFGEAVRVSGGSVPDSAFTSLSRDEAVPSGCPRLTYSVAGLL